jgi:hypothetical protein
VQGGGGAAQLYPFCSILSIVQGTTKALIQSKCGRSGRGRTASGGGKSTVESVHFGLNSRLRLGSDHAGGNVRERRLKDIWENSEPIAFNRRRTVDDLWGLLPHLLLCRDLHGRPWAQASGCPEIRSDWLPGG